ncbi:hypothetical protein ABL78_1066 [Leptomonas seymouri]|uniref:Uncharacterized protein n=1 Tax=Leptomonas seymouri TaxID=5684 RepID=A0A0N1I2Q1_LEPSE|nr:hypothetical protein ABL78_1066 [Leptomonas seymouri]|eukprot:KPI89803.1 hypothetical protein ABL78_1066 [Leptomonas seymouri]
MSFGNFGVKPATGAVGFGAAPAAGGGFGSVTPAAGGTGFGAKPATGGGFGGGFGAAAPAAGGGFGAAGLGTGGGGFGTSSAATSGGFGAGAAGGGFGARPTAAPSFGSTSGGGFGAPAVSTGFNASAGTTGFGAGRGGFGLGGATGGGFGGLGGTATTAAANMAPTAAQYPYPGIKGPGNSMSWAREVDFSQVTEQTPFESLPQPLQQHLMELRSFMHAEREASRKIYEYLNESDIAASTSGSAASANGTAGATATGSYRNLMSKLAALKGGGNRAVDIVAVQCNQHEGQARRQLQRTEKLEASVRDYERHVWEPLLEQGLQLSASSSSSGPRSGSYRPAVNSDAASPFVSLVEELTRRLDNVSENLAALEATLVPPGRLLRGSGSGDRPGHRGGSATPSDAIAQINASLLYELNQLRDISCVAAHLHGLTDTARELFTRQYGQAEADVLFTDTEAQRNSMALFRRATASAYFDIPPLPQERPPPAAPAANTLGSFGAKPATAATTATPGGFGAPAVGGFGGKPAASAATTTAGAGGGFGFGALAPAATTATAGATSATTASVAPATLGFGAPVAPAPVAPTAAAGGFGAPASASNAPAAPTMGPALPTGAPTSFSLGGAATNAVGFSAGPGKSSAGDDDRPTRRTR